MDVQVTTQKELSVDLAYLAGLFDAEGTFVIRRQDEDYIRPVISLYNNNEALLRHAQSILGGNVHSVSRAHRSNKHNNSFILDFCSHENVSRVCSALRPHLILKAKQCDLLSRLHALSDAEKEEAFKEACRLNEKAVIHTFTEKKSTQVDLSAVNAADWAYFAGWVDGDGTLIFQPQYFVGTRYLYPWVCVYSTKPEALEHIFNIFGGTLKVRTRRANWALEGSVRFTDQRYVAKILLGLLPYLREKKQKATILLNATQVEAKNREPFLAELKGLSK